MHKNHKNLANSHVTNALVAFTHSTFNFFYTEKLKRPLIDIQGHKGHEDSTGQSSKK